MAYQHYPVLQQEVLQLLDAKPGQNFIDGTLGGGGYSSALLAAVGPTGKVLSIDLDQTAVDNFASFHRKYQSTSIVVHGNFKDIDEIVARHGLGDIKGIVVDLGLSSYHIDSSKRGISFQVKEPLDMRFDLSNDTPDARFILNNYSEAQIFKIFTDYGEEQYSKQIARKVVEARRSQLLHYTTDLAEIITEVLPKPVKHKAGDHCRRIFQALRIAVNHELANLETFLPKALDIVTVGGRVVVVSFHSLEDRIVKNFFVQAATGCICPPEFPQCICGRAPRAKILTKKPMTATDQELNKNTRSKPAKLRAIEKL